MRLRPDDRLDVGKTEQRSTRPIRPDHLIEARGKDRHGVAGRKAPPHGVECRDVDVGILALWHARHRNGGGAAGAKVNALLIKRRGAGVHLHAASGAGF